MKFIKKYLIYLILWMFPLAITAQHLEKYLQVATVNNPALQAIQSEYEMSLQHIVEEKTLTDPTVSLGYFVSPIETRLGPQNAKLSLRQQFPWFGTLRIKEKKATHLADAKYHQVTETKNKLYYQVKALYYQIYEVKEHIKRQENNLKILNTYKQLATKRYANNKGTITDVLRVDIMIENTTTDISILSEEVKPLEVAFYNILNDPITIPVQIDSLSIPIQPYPHTNDSPWMKNPKLSRLDQKIYSAEADESLAKKSGLPKFVVGLDYAMVGRRSDVNITDNGRNAIMPMMSVSIPIWKKKYKAAKQKAKLMNTALQSKKEHLINNLNSSYKMLIFKMNKAKTEHELYSKQIEKTQQIINLLYKTYSNSGSDIEEILRTQQQLLKYHIMKTTSIKEYFTARAELEYITGNTNKKQ